MKHIVTDVYVSEDGKCQFADKDECLKYDKFAALRNLAHDISKHRIDDVEFANFVVDNWSQINSIMDFSSSNELDELRAQLVASQATNKALIEVLVRILDNDGEEGSKRLDPMKHYQARVDAKALISGQGGTEALDRLLAATYSEILNHLDGRIERVIEWAEWEFASSLRELRVDVAEFAKQKGLTS